MLHRDPLSDRSADVVGDQTRLPETQLLEQLDQQLRLTTDGGVAVKRPLRVAIAKQVIGDDSVASVLNVRHDLAPLV